MPAMINENIVEAVARVKQQHDGDFMVAGSATSIQTLVEHHVFDEYHLLVYLLGRGKRLFQNGSKTTLNLLESNGFTSGVVLPVCQPERHAL